MTDTDKLLTAIAAVVYAIGLGLMWKRAKRAERETLVRRISR